MRHIDQPFAGGPRLLADIGATHARFALESRCAVFEQVRVLQCADFGGFAEVVEAYLAAIEGDRPRHAAIAIANPIDGDLVRMTNRDWRFSIEETRRRLGFATLLMVNDFTALAQALPRLPAPERVQIGGGVARTNGVVGLIGPGTGLGVSGLICDEEGGGITLGSEGGHVRFAPSDEREMFILSYAWRELKHVSAERLVSGTGLELIYRALCERDQARPPSPVPGASEIVSRALSGGDARCSETVECFCAMLGTVASDLAVTLGAVGGIYIGGGIVPRMLPLFLASPFRQRFEDKGRFSDYVSSIPTYVITAEYPAFRGVSAILAHHLRGSEPRGDSALLGRIRAALPQLSRAERRVAETLLNQPRGFLNESIAEISRSADVSQPTVIRFCRTLGFPGLADFKLNLASGLTGAIPVRHSQVRPGDTAPDLTTKVLENTVSAILTLRDRLDADCVERAIDLIEQARRIELYGDGGAGVVALDGQHKFLRLRIPANAYAEPRLELMAAELLGKGDVVIAISGSGALPELLAAVDAARAQGAAVIAITAPDTPLARSASVTLAVEHDEHGPTQVSMISRILHLLVIDVLAVGAAMRQADLRSPRVAAQRGQDGEFGRLTSHAAGPRRSTG